MEDSDTVQAGIWATTLRVDLRAEYGGIAKRGSVYSTATASEQASGPSSGTPSVTVPSTSSARSPREAPRVGFQTDPHGDHASIFVGAPPDLLSRHSRAAAIRTGSLATRRTSSTRRAPAQEVLEFYAPDLSVAAQFSPAVGSIPGERGPGPSGPGPFV